MTFLKLPALRAGVGYFLAVPLPVLTTEQRKAAGEKATAARRARAEICAQLKSGALSMREVLDRAESDEAIAKLKVTHLLESLPGVGKTKASAIMKRNAIAESRRLRGLGPYQRAALIEEFG